MLRLFTRLLPNYAARALQISAGRSRTAWLLGGRVEGWREGVRAAQTTETPDPGKVQIVTSDISHFWRAYDLAKKSADPATVYAHEYFAEGSRGLWGFVPDRLLNPWHLRDIVAKYSDYYAAARPAMAAIPQQRPRILDDLRRYKQIYPAATFPNVYFVVGTLNSGGASVDGVGLVIGAEMVSRPAVLNVKMPGFNTAVLSTPAKIPALIAHEFTHYNQRDADRNTLLDASIYEGTADFMSQLVDGHNVDAAQWPFGCTHEDDLWTLFKSQMGTADPKIVGSWLFSYSAGPLGSPSFIGYWLGSRIVQSYYESRADKRAAVDAIMHITDFQAFLSASGYPEHRPPCAPQPRIAGDLPTPTAAIAR